ncbi:MAG: hypothetical protein HY403_09725 [Elusimicrobia bacterium]|nr:hypothetical protein [Elusimicrobiota bacterium]
MFKKSLVSLASAAVLTAGPGQLAATAAAQTSVRGPAARVTVVPTIGTGLMSPVMNAAPLNIPALTPGVLAAPALPGAPILPSAAEAAPAAPEDSPLTVIRDARAGVEEKGRALDALFEDPSAAANVAAVQSNLVRPGGEVDSYVRGVGLDLSLMDEGVPVSRLEVELEPEPVIRIQYDSSLGSANPPKAIYDAIMRVSEYRDHAWVRDAIVVIGDANGIERWSTGVVGAKGGRLVAPADWASALKDYAQPLEIYTEGPAATSPFEGRAHYSVSRMAADEVIVRRDEGWDRTLYKTNAGKFVVLRRPHDKNGRPDAANAVSGVKILADKKSAPDSSGVRLRNEVNLLVNVFRRGRVVKWLNEYLAAHKHEVIGGVSVVSHGWFYSDVSVWVEGPALRADVLAAAIRARYADAVQNWNRGPAAGLPANEDFQPYPFVFKDVSTKHLEGLRNETLSAQGEITKARLLDRLNKNQSWDRMIFADIQDPVERATYELVHERFLPVLRSAVENAQGEDAPAYARAVRQALDEIQAVVQNGATIDGIMAELQPR